MIDINLLREEPEKVKKGIASKNVNPSLVDEFLDWDKKWREIVGQLDGLRQELNRLSRERKIEEAKLVKEQIKVKEAELPAIEAEREKVWLQIPNPPFAEVPVGKNELDNLVLREVGKKRKFDFQPKDCFALAEKFNLIDTARAAKVSGSRFGYLLNDAVRLEFALAQFVLQTVTDQSLIRKLIKEEHMRISDKPFIPVIPPVLVNKKSMGGMGYLERGEEEIYFFPKDDLYLVGTSEQSIGPMRQDETFDENDLPCRYLGFSTCFRREAGSYGKDTKGILRVHQFDKLEMFSFARPDESRSEHLLLLKIEEYLMRELKIPYRILNICSGDLGDSAASKFDVEAWMPGQNGGKGEYRETHSTSNTTDFQARRLNIKYKQDVKGKKPKVEFVHMLNGTAFAIGRILIAILENYQTKEGKIEVPKVLRKSVGKKIIG